MTGSSAGQADDNAEAGRTASDSIRRLLDMMAALRTPGSGCSWDLQQDHASLSRYAIEEAYELADAILRDDAADIRQELGDCLLQVVFHARVAEEAGNFDFAGVVETICNKLVRRHPHLTLEKPHIRPRHLSADACTSRSETFDVRAQWEAIKAQERAQRDPAAGLLAGVPTALPGLTRAVILQARAATVGFDWIDPRSILAKIREEIDEVEVELAEQSEGLLGEIGDLFFAVANLARRTGVDPEAAVRYTNAKFERRFAFIERALHRQGSSPMEASLEMMEELWTEAKLQEGLSTPSAQVSED